MVTDFIFRLMTQYIQSGESVIISSPAKLGSIDRSHWRWEHPLLAVGTVGYTVVASQSASPFGEAQGVGRHKKPLWSYQLVGWAVPTDHLELKQ